ncbi:MAG TPA: cytochrome D1 domain-containing protein [Ottowia sp.]|uniref:cytochrome D1 domain-containing protein n=1 Tax=Ottowia sp. TaxID=1898956 RepID=UPI002CCD3189|nr:cytochrome D1 domain-containing protein [Ottowia sp.]HMN20478.1 cytochrome D1 domain-containing protein [Ottowia sp.]
MLVLLVLPAAWAGAQTACEAALATPAGTEAALQSADWDEDAVRASRRVLADTERAEQVSVAAESRDLVLVIEANRDQVAVVDGERLEVLRRLPTRPALLDAPQVTPDGRYAFLASRAGWIGKLDLRTLALVAEVRAGQRLRGMALSSDGRWLLAGNEAPASVLLFDADLNLASWHGASALDGRQVSAVSALADAAPRRSFVVAFERLAELWEISYDPRAEPIYDGLVHDYKMGEGIAKPGFLNMRRTPLEAPFTDLGFDPDTRLVLGRLRPAAGDGAEARVQVVHLDVRRKIAEFALAGQPRLGAATPLRRGDGVLLAVPNAATAMIDLLERKSWRRAGSIPVPGPGCFIRAHPRVAQAWADAMLSAGGRDRLIVIDVDALTATVLRVPGQVGGAVAFTRDGRHALVSVSAPEPGLIVYDTRTLAMVKRLPLGQPR